jgi:dihydrofolate reductase
VRRIVVCTNVSLDGVMQAPGRADEDPRNGFEHGGWAAPYAAMAQAGQVFATADALLLGRRTYEDFYRVWPKRPESPFTPWLNGIRKYVASRTLASPLAWVNSVLLTGDAAATVKPLKAEAGKDILVMGSGALVRSLMAAQLIDEYVLLIHPLVLGSGTRLFGPMAARAKLSLVGSTTTSSGVVIATYRPEATA